MTIEPLQRRTFEAQHLMSTYPPLWGDMNKAAVFGVSCPPGAVFGGELAFSRWAPIPLPSTLAPHRAAALSVDVPGYFDYTPVADDTDEWHLNFADPHLFVAYSSSLFAQDEMQVTEHPSLGALRQAIEAAGLPTRTVEAGAPTPVLIRGIERRCEVSTDPNPAAGRPHGLYGNAFSRASVDAVLAATRRIDPPTITNLIAIAAPYPSSGRYTPEEIRYTLDAAFTGFRAAVQESQAANPGARVVVHTGFWGCGAFGGDRVLMSLLQMLAAAMARVDILVLHTGDASGAASVDDARLVAADLDEEMTVDELLRDLIEMHFEWGVSDGN